MRGFFSDDMSKETLISHETSYSFSIFLLLNLSNILKSTENNLKTYIASN